MKHNTTPQFWEMYNKLPEPVQRLADKNFKLLQMDPQHPSLHFKKIEGMWSARVGAHYRAVGFDQDGGILWFWIGSHADYDKLLS
ncbi:MAG: hypothetical protein M3Y56_04120 [Armatimonadota bacterium]|nr:hypothetical protein [Armatimonadota bacterium]